MDYSLKKCLAVALSFMGALWVCAADFVDSPKVSVAFAVRADFVYERPNDDQEPTSGIYGKFLNLMLNGTINDQLSYSWRQRMNRFDQVGNDAFAATDWVYLRYQPTDHWAFSAGKEIVLIGGFEIFPIKASKDLRIHMICDRISDNVGVHYTQFNVGLTWRMSLYDNY